MTHYDVLAVIIGISAFALLMLVNAVGAWMWTKSLAEVNRIGAFRQQKQSERETVEAALDANETLQQMRLGPEDRPEPTDAELRAALLLARRNGHSGQPSEVFEAADEVGVSDGIGSREYRS